MGGNNSTSNNNSNIRLQSSVDYELLPFLVQRIPTLPSSFASQIQNYFDQIEELRNKVLPHKLQNYIINSLQYRFSKYNQINNKNLKQGKSGIQILTIDKSKFKNQKWLELQSTSSFLSCVSSIMRQYEVEQLLQNQYYNLQNKKGSISCYQTLRKPIYKQKQQKFDQSLIIRLIYHYYLSLLKRHSNNDKNVIKFHKQTGRKLCFILFFGYISREELFYLLYLLVEEQKTDNSLNKILFQIREKYHNLCLRTSYTINTSQKKLQDIRTAARLYLDQLYLNSVKQAEDPDIRITDDTLMPIKMFPITRVKQKQKN